MSSENRNHAIHELILDLSFGRINLPEKLETCIQNIQFADGMKRQMLIQQAIGYVIAMKDFKLLDYRVCNAIIDRLHDAR